MSGSMPGGQTMAFVRETTVYTGPMQDQVNTGIIKLDLDLTNAFTYLNQLLSSLAAKINATEKGVASGICPLDSSAKIATGYLPSIPVGLIPSTVGAPVGSGLIWYTDTAPENYLACEGQYLSTTTYSALYAVLGTRYGAGSGTFRLPDFRGYFPRGWSHGSGVDPDAGSRTNRGDGTVGDNVGTKQGTQNLAHTHVVIIGTEGVAQGGALAYGLNSPSGLGGMAQSSGGNESRPPNMNVLFCIKYQ